jgi:hypothetical protein
MRNMKRLAVVGVTATTLLVVSALGASATTVGAQTLTTIENGFAATLQAAGLTFSPAAFEAEFASGVLHPFGQFVSSLARTIPPGPMHGKLVSSFARHMNPSNFNNSNSHHREGGEARKVSPPVTLPPQAEGHGH